MTYLLMLCILILDIHIMEVPYVMARTTISIPDRLAERLEPLKDHINVSEICQRALEARIETYERIAALSEEDVMEKLVQRLKIQKQESTQWSAQQVFQQSHAQLL